MNGIRDRYAISLKLSKLPLFRRLRWIIYSGLVLICGALFFLQHIVQQLWLKAFLCYVSSFLVLVPLLEMVKRSVPIQTQRGSPKSSAAIAALWITIFTYLFPNRLLLWVLVILIISLVTLPVILRVVISRVFPALMYRQCVSGVPGAWGKVGLVFGEPGLASHFAYRLVQEFSVPFPGKRAFFLLMESSFRRFPRDFLAIAMRRIPCLLFLTEIDTQQDAMNFKSVVGKYDVCPGLIFEVLLLRDLYELPPHMERKGVELFPLVFSSEEHEREQMREFISSLRDRLEATVIPIGESDEQLPHKLHELVHIVATRTLPPLANCYLRVRLAKSNLERFLCLLDCIEVVIKMSAIYLLVAQWRCGGNPALVQLHTQLHRPALGHWIRVLRTLISSAPCEDILSQNVTAFWEQPLGMTPQQLISDANDLGLAYLGKLPRINLEWLEWFSWLRNVTRAHGVINENIASTLWHSFHETFLQMVAGLSLLVSDSQLVAATTGQEPLVLSGWTKSMGDADEGGIIQPLTKSLVSLRTPAPKNAIVSLYPFLLQQGPSVLLWNAVHNNSVEFIDYHLGKNPRLVLSGTNPYDLWREGANL